AAAAGVDDRYARGRAARLGASPGRGRQAGASRSDRPADVRPLSRGTLSRVRPRARTVPPTALPRSDQAKNPGRAVDVLLPGLPNIGGWGAMGLRGSGERLFVPSSGPAPQLPSPEPLSRNHRLQVLARDDEAAGAAAIGAT